MDIDKIDLSAVENGEVRSYESRFESFRKLNSKLDIKFLVEFSEKFIGENFDYEYTIDIIMFLDYLIISMVANQDLKHIKMKLKKYIDI